jgi:hypothetical protein
MIDEEGGISRYVLVLRPLIPVRGLFARDLACPHLGEIPQHLVEVAVVVDLLTTCIEMECCRIEQKNDVDYVSIKMMVFIIKRRGKRQLTK